MAIICPKCHSENRDDSKFCSNCGAPLGSGSGSGAGQEEASFTKTLETPVLVLKPGTVIAGKYRIVEEVGAGGKLLLNASASWGTRT